MGREVGVWYTKNDLSIFDFLQIAYLLSWDIFKQQ